ncbi:MAG: class II fructose-bisphosphate aldolase, partial [Parasporobacterium sp.]|nr:class II fructose-bisphosphate aldolase [Parasporobacterium sp.]
MNSNVGKEKRMYFAFNVWDVNSATAVIDAAAEIKTDVILQTSQRVYQALEKDLFKEYIRKYAKQKGIECLLHLDHCRDLKILYDAVDHGWDIVMYDGSALPLAENIENTKKACAYAHSGHVRVEAEVGCIKGVEDDIAVKKDGLASIEDVRQMLKNTDIDYLAAAFGNAHGLYQGKPNLHFEIIEEIQKISDIPFVVHGGTGMGRDTFKKLIVFSNVGKINISTGFFIMDQIRFHGGNRCKCPAGTIWILVADCGQIL